MIKPDFNPIARTRRCELEPRAAAVDVASGRVRGSLSDTRTEADFVAFLQTLFASAARWQVVCDNLNTHMSEGVTRLGCVTEIAGHASLNGWETA